jgi:hypothetical protein
VEPIVSNAGAARLAIAPQASAANAVLREGRIVAAQVLGRSGDGSLLLAIGRQQVPTQTALELEPGRAFLARVVVDSGGLALTILPELDAEPGPDSLLLRALRAVVGEERPSGELLGDLLARLRAAAGAPGQGSRGPSALLERLEAHAYRPELGAGANAGAVLARLLARSGLRYEAALLAAGGGGPAALVLEALAGDLKAELLRALHDLEDAELRDAVRRALGALESEQLLNLARARAGEPRAWSFPIADGAGWASARLRIEPGHDDGRSAAGSTAGPSALHVVLSVDFSSLGPVRVDVALATGALHVRLLAERAEIAERLRAESEPLARRLEDGRHAVHVFARAATPGELGDGEHPLDIRFLREHHLMDVSV